jgi:hypothetical protein
MVHLSPFSSLSAINMHPITLNKSVVDKSMGQLLPKGQKSKLCTRKILPRKVGIYLRDPKNEGKHMNWPPICHPSQLKSKTLFLSTVLTLIVVVIDTTTVGIVVCDDVRVLECGCDNLTLPIHVMTSGLLLTFLWTRCPIRGHEAHNVVGFFHAKQMKMHTVKLTWQRVRVPNFLVGKMRGNCISIDVLWPVMSFLNQCCSKHADFF